MFYFYIKIGDIFFFFLFSNVLILGFIFWLLSFLAEYFFSKSYYRLEKDLYECGFYSLSDININININFLLFSILLVLYDLEFTFLIPYILQLLNSVYISIFVFFFFFFSILISFYLDWKLNILTWYIK